MEDIFSVATSNRFSCFMEEDDDPGDAIIPPRKAIDKSEKKLDKKVEKSGKVTRVKENKDKPLPAVGKKTGGEPNNRRRDGPQPGMWKLVVHMLEIVSHLGELVSSCYHTLVLSTGVYLLLSQTHEVVGMRG